MLVFGPYSAIPQDENFMVFNMSSLTQAIPRLPGLIVSSNMVPQIGGEFERSFDLWYYEYVLNNPEPCSSLMAILQALYDGHKVYVCISDYESDPFMSVINESFMKIIQVRYDIKYSVINAVSDYDYIDKDGCDFMSVTGINNFDQDRKRYLELSLEEKIMHG